ncbi:hypothetical protein AYO22_04360 [Fonsecaea multimorphosa]|nr:hypothetical protein AYO22_04360 [Fonsecaea multimorphosa]
MDLDPFTKWPEHVSRLGAETYGEDGIQKRGESAVSPADLFDSDASKSNDTKTPKAASVTCEKDHDASPLTNYVLMVQDPHNFGAISHIVWHLSVAGSCKRGRADLETTRTSPVVQTRPGSASALFYAQEFVTPSAALILLRGPFQRLMQLETQQVFLEYLVF